MLKNKRNKYLLQLLVLTFIPFTADNVRAQESPVPLVDSPVSASTLSMGGVGLMSATDHYIYTNPSSLLYQDKTYTLSLSGALRGKHLNAEGRLKDVNVSAGWHFLDNQALFAGFRYQGGLTYLYKNGLFEGGLQQEYKPYDWLASLGYAFRIDDAWSLFATGHFVYQYSGRPASGGIFSIGANYKVILDNRDRSNYTGYTRRWLNLSARISGVGTPLYYSKEESYPFPAKGEATGELFLTPHPHHRLRFLLGADAGFLRKELGVLAGTLATEYTYHDILTLRAGIHPATRESGRWSVGGGVCLYGIQVGMAYSWGLHDSYTNLGMLSLSYIY